MKVKHFKTLSAYLEYTQFPEPEHPLFTIIELGNDQFPCTPLSSSPPISNECYSISLKKVVGGELTYGRTKFDFTKGAMVFTGPRQVMSWNAPAGISSIGYVIIFHEDFIKGTALANTIHKFNFFSYSANEALHVSPKEQQLIENIFKSIQAEYDNSIDEFSKEIFISQIETLLKYANRFYKRQFLNREELNSQTLTQFKAYLENHYTQGKFETEGAPAIDTIAEQLHMSHRYMSDSIKTETGKTAIDQINLFVVDKAKNLLLEPNHSVSEVAYKLGFEYPSYFSRLFKRKVGDSPAGYRKTFLAN